MSKKRKWLIPFAVLSLTCGVSVGVLSGCGGHQHEYTKSNHNETQHWMECPEDGEKDPDSIKDHDFVDGKCECGQTQPHEHAYTKWRSNDEEHWKVCPDDNAEQAGSRAKHDFVDGKCECGVEAGSASGTVKLYKEGAYVTDYTGVTATLNDSAVQLGENGAIRLENLIVGNTYELKIAKDGYVAYSEYIEPQKGVDHGINGGNDVVLQYQIFKSIGAQDSNVDYSKMNDGEIKLTGNGNIKLNTVAMYDEVSATVNFKFADGWDTWEDAATNKHKTMYYAALYFENGKNIRVQLCINENRHFVLQDAPHDSLMIDGEGGWEDWHGEGYWCNDGVDVADPVRKMYADNGNVMPYSIARKGENVYISALGITKTYVLPDAYKNQKAGIRIGIEADDAFTDSLAGAGFTYEIKDKNIDVSEFVFRSRMQDANVDYSKAGTSEGEIKFTGNGSIKLDTTRKYDNVAATANFKFPENWDNDQNGKKDKSVYYVALAFSNGKNIRVELSMNGDGSKTSGYALAHVGHDNMMVEGQGGWDGDWSGFNWCGADKVQEMLDANGGVMPYTIVRNGDKVIINAFGLTRLYTLPDNYKNQQVSIRFGVECSDGTSLDFNGTGFTYTISEELPECEIALEENGGEVTGCAAVLNKTNFALGETGTLSLTVPENAVATVTIDGNVQNYYADSEIPFTAYKDSTVSVAFAELAIVTKEVAVDTALNGKTLTLTKDGGSPITLTVAGGKVMLDGVSEGKYDVALPVMGTTLKATCNIYEDMTELELSFATGTANINLSGEFVYQQKNDDSPTVKVDLAQGVSGDAYVALKLSTDVAKDNWVLQHEELHLGVWMTVGGSKHWVELHWRNWESGDFGIHSDSAHDHKGTEVLKQNLWQPIEGFSFGNHGWNMNAYGEAFMGDGIYLVMKYESATGNVDVLLAKADGYVKVCTFDAMFEAGKELTAFGVGKIGNDYNYHSCPGGFKIDCVLKYGSTLGAATGEDLT